MPGFTRFHPLAFTRYCLIHRHFKSWVKPVKGNYLIRCISIKTTTLGDGIMIPVTLIFSEPMPSKIKLYYQRSKHLFIINELRTFARHFKKMKNNE